ncbi:hypothetical protein, partial [Pseudomonas aeruginosa]
DGRQELRRPVSTLPVVAPDEPGDAVADREAAPSPGGPASPEAVDHRMLPWGASFPPSSFDPADPMSGH